MQLRVIDPTPPAPPWYADGLSFTCTQCGNCCTGGPGYVWLTESEVERLAEFLKLSPRETVRKFCRNVSGRLSLREKLNQGNYDCVFLTHDDKGKRGCSIYPVRPLQCRTWPFWDGLLKSRESWSRAAKGCPGMNHGKRYSQDRVEALRDADDWPDDAPGSRNL